MRLVNNLAHKKYEIRDKKYILSTVNFVTCYPGPIALPSVSQLTNPREMGSQKGSMKH